MKFRDLKYLGQPAWPPGFNGGTPERFPNDVYNAVLLEPTLSPGGECIELKTSLGRCDMFFDNAELDKVLRSLKSCRGTKLWDIGDVELDK